MANLTLVKDIDSLDQKISKFFEEEDHKILRDAQDKLGYKHASIRKLPVLDSLSRILINAGISVYLHDDIEDYMRSKRMKEDAIVGKNRKRLKRITRKQDAFYMSIIVLFVFVPVILGIVLAGAYTGGTYLIISLVGLFLIVPIMNLHKLSFINKFLGEDEKQEIENSSHHPSEHLSRFIWQTYSIVTYNKPIPVWALQKALKVKEVVPDCKILISSLERNQVSADPVMLVRQTIEGQFGTITTDVAIAVWDEPDFHGKEITDIEY